jgi:transcriptional regulator with XRE-family HTH domain
MDPTRTEIARFLRSARNRLNPADYGITSTGRRRTPGLRREEVATLAGISLTWYTWFEQGRDINPSAEVLDNLAVVLRLDEKEREFLFLLAQGRPPPLTPSLHEDVNPGARLVLDTIGVPALVINEHWTVVGWNDLYTHLFRDFGSMPTEERNLLRVLLLSKHYQQSDEDFRKMVKRLTARLRWDYSRAKDRSFFDTLIREMRPLCPAFDQYWQETDIADSFEASHSVGCERIGRIDLHHTSYAIEGVLGQRMVLYAPEDKESRERLDKVIADLREKSKAA